jgi:hypothetical protein
MVRVRGARPEFADAFFFESQPANAASQPRHDWRESREVVLPIEFRGVSTEIQHLVENASGKFTGETILLQNHSGDTVQIEVTPDDRASPDKSIHSRKG